MCLILQGTPNYSPSCLGTSSASARLSQLFFFAGCPRFGESESCTGGLTRKCNNQASYILRATSLSLWGKYIWITLETNLSRTLRNSLWICRIVEPRTITISFNVSISISTMAAMTACVAVASTSTINSKCRRQKRSTEEEEAQCVVGSSWEYQCCFSFASLNNSEKVFGSHVCAGLYDHIPFVKSHLQPFTAINIHDLKCMYCDMLSYRIVKNILCTYAFRAPRAPLPTLIHHKSQAIAGRSKRMNITQRWCKYFR